VAVVGHVERFLDRGVAAADHRHLLAPVEEAVASGAGGHPLALQPFFGRQVQPFRLCTRGDHDGVAGVDGAAIANHPERALREIDVDDMVPHHPGADMFRLCLHLLHQPRTLDHVAEAGIIFDVGCDGELPTRLHPLDHDRRHAGAGSIDCSGQARGTGAEDEHTGGMGRGH
jgi:hypothetical protein